MIWLFYILFALVTILLSFLILLQEGKGGGMGGAFGGVGGEAFGHGAGGINKATGVLAAVYMLSAVAIALYSAGSDSVLG